MRPVDVRSPNPSAFSADAAITIDDESLADINFYSAPENGTVFIHAHKYGTADITVIDGGDAVQYTLEIYKEEGADQIRITPAG